MKPIRQGDVLLKPVSELPRGPLKRHTQLTLAYGEATGHHHTLYAKPTPTRDVNVDEVVINGKRFIRLNTEWLLRHQEHKELRIPPGCYEIVIEQEYDPFEKALIRVRD